MIFHLVPFEGVGRSRPNSPGSIPRWLGPWTPPSHHSIPPAKFRHSGELSCLVVSNLQPAPRPVSRSRLWLQIRHHQDKSRANGCPRLACVKPAILCFHQFGCGLTLATNCWTTGRRRGPFAGQRARYTQTAPVARSIPVADLDLEPLSVKLSVKVVASSETVVASFGK